MQTCAHAGLNNAHHIISYPCKAEQVLSKNTYACEIRCSTLSCACIISYKKVSLSVSGQGTQGCVSQETWSITSVSGQEIQGGANLET